MENLDLTNLTIYPFAKIAPIVFYFTIYSLFGWLLENSYSMIKKNGFFKEGFFVGPFKPMYGFAPLLLIGTLSAETHWLVLILLCFLIPTTVEYISGALLQKFFQRKWWDYSNEPLQLHGHICLVFSIYWIFLSIICWRFIHPVVESFYTMIEGAWDWMLFPMLIYFATEVIFAFQRHSPIHLKEERVRK